MDSDNFGMHPIFKFRTKPTEEILALLESVTLGTDGAHYRHLDTRERIQEADNPLFLSMERHQKVLGNVTFCKRDKHWYIRYFAFDGAHQANGKKKSSSQGLLKQELTTFFDDRLQSGEVDSFYAYIDPRNVKSLWMSENFGFETTSKIATQTYSSVRKPKKGRVVNNENPTEIPSQIISQFQNQRFFFEDQLKKGNHFSILNEEGELLAFAKTTSANWEIKRLPGKMGGFLVNVLPFIPFLNKLIRPKKHSFTVPEAVFVKDNNPDLLKELFDGILTHLNQRLLIWWVDEKDELYSTIKSKINWGLLHKVIGVSHANLVERSSSKAGGMSGLGAQTRASYTSGFDFI